MVAAILITLTAVLVQIGWIQLQNHFQNQSGSFPDIQFENVSFFFFLLGKRIPLTFIITATHYLNSVILHSYLKLSSFSLFSYIRYILFLRYLLLFSLFGNLERNKYKVLFLFSWSTAYLNIAQSTFVSLSNYQKHKFTSTKERTSSWDGNMKTQQLITMEATCCPRGRSTAFQVMANSTRCVGHLTGKEEMKEDLQIYFYKGNFLND